uniref:Ski_Sno domain-containing protein n=1 Tax=Macrostomum lignano TaxID=282301 RepID=A0A1I8GJV4_9PLAT
AFDCCVCIGSCLVNFGLHFSGAKKLLRDLLALLVAARLSRTVQLCRGLSYTEKQRLIQLLNSQHQVEAAGAERLRKLQTELANRDLECQDLRALIKAATLSRHRLKMKQQLQMEKPLPEHRMLSPPPSTPTERVSQHQQRHHPYDSGHSSDSAPESPQEPEPAAAIQPDEDQQLSVKQQQRKPQALKEIN